MLDFRSPYFGRPGVLEVIPGCMFSGKTEELITQIRRAEIARLRFQVFKPEIDTRYSNDSVSSHNKRQFPAINVKNSDEILDKVDPLTEIIGLDEAQFFDMGLIKVAEQLVDSGKNVIVAGLDTDWRGEPFGPMPFLMAKADVVRKQYAICMVCGAPATRTQRIVSSQDQLLLGSTDAYEARCRKHFDPDFSLRIRKIAAQAMGISTPESVHP